MECNKEEALRAKTLAEQKMESKDFLGAKKLALMAQRLFPDLENVSQMITVCDIHCSAAMKTNGIEDWYGILQVEPSADASTIKKQYKKLAFSLHPDKNKFLGAKAAFNMVSEAHRVLSDCAKRPAYDVRRTSIKNGGPKAPGQSLDSFAKVPSQCQKKFINSNTVQPNGFKQQHSEGHSAGKSFWTSCPYCHLKYRYYHSVMNRALRCQHCMRPFIAFDINAQNEVLGPAGRASSCLHSPPNIGDPRSNGPSSWCMKGYNQPNSGNTSYRIGSEGNMKKWNTETESKLHNGDKEADCGTLTDKSKQENGGNSAKEVDQLMKNSLKFLKRKQTAGNTVSNNTHRSDVAKAFSAAADAKSVDEFESFKKQRRDATISDTEQNQACLLKDKGGVKCQNWLEFKWGGRPPEQASAEKTMRDEHDALQDGILGKGVNSMPGSKNPTLDRSVPDPEFCDFELRRNGSSFRVGQIWALYDEFDGMPRFYAEIKKTSSRSFKILFTWLEYDPANKSEKHWYGRKLPVACGNFKSGKTAKSKVIAMFSHVMSFEKGAKRNSYKIRPRKGEIWALYGGWDVKWAFEPENHRSFDFQIVEVVSDNLTDNGFGIKPLSKVKGFVSVFTKAPDGGELLYVPPNELLRFSHMIPSYKLTGKERDGIPEGSYELDTAALPAYIHSPTSTAPANAVHSSIRPGSRLASQRKRNAYAENNAVSKNQREMPIVGNDHGNQCSEECTSTNDLNLKSDERHENVKIGQNLPGGTSLKCTGISKDGVFSSTRGASSKIAADCLPASPETCGLGGVEFHQFDADKSFNKLRRGQIWALYSDDDGFPKYYALIKEVDVDSPKVNVVWLAACPELVEEAQWVDKGLLSGCGRFMPLTGKDGQQTYDNVDAFSHQVNAQPSGEDKMYKIYPLVGEIWAIYKNWSAEWRKVDLSECEYDIVEICVTTDHMIKVQFLEKVEGFFAVFMRRKSMPITTEIPLTSALKFSHRIPSFLLTEEREGTLRGSWELDPSSVPEVLLCVTGS